MLCNCVIGTQKLERKKWQRSQKQLVQKCSEVYAKVKEGSQRKVETW